MTVAELIDILEKLPKELPVMIYNESSVTHKEIAIVSQCGKLCRGYNVTTRRRDTAENLQIPIVEILTQ